MRIGSLEIGSGQPCRVVAELSNAHNGDRDRLGRLIDAAQAAGADIVKFQAYTPDELVALRGNGPAPQPWGGQGYSMKALYEKAQTPLAWFPKIAAHCERVGMPWFSSVFGKESLAALEAVGCPAYKISHFERRNIRLIELVRATGKPVLVSGVPTAEGSFDGYADYDARIYCPGAYPTASQDLHLSELRCREDPYFEWLGLSSHCTDPLVGPLTVAFGAHYLEYHFMLAAEPSELEANVSLTERQFQAMVASVRQAEVLCG